MSDSALSCFNAESLDFANLSDGVTIYDITLPDGDFQRALAMVKELAQEGRPVNDDALMKRVKDKEATE